MERTKETWEKLKSEINIGDIIYGKVFKVEPYDVNVDLSIISNIKTKNSFPLGNLEGAI